MLHYDTRYVYVLRNVLFFQNIFILSNETMMSVCNPIFILDKLTAVFINSGSRPMDIFWIRSEGDEVAYSSNVLPGQEITQQTYFTHSWIFKVTGTNTRLSVKANGYDSTSFQASSLGVTPGTNLDDAIVYVYISDGTLQ